MLGAKEVDCIQGMLRIIHQTLSPWGKRHFYSHVVPQLHVIIKGISLPCINKDLVDFMSRLEKYFVTEEFFYVKVYRSKLNI